MVVLIVLNSHASSYNNDILNELTYLESMDVILHAGRAIAATNAAMLNHCFGLWRADIEVLDALGV